jgi:DNA-binding NtrC family response regulator
MSYDWPGNVRELENVVQRSLANCDSDNIDVTDLPEEIQKNPPRRPIQEMAFEFKEYVELARERAGRQYLESLMKAYGGRVADASETAGIERESLYRLLKKFQISPIDFK